MKGLEEERGAIEMWLKGLEEGSSNFYSYTTDPDMRVYQDGRALAYGDMRKMVREEEDPISKIEEYAKDAERWLKKAWSEEEGLRCRGRLDAARDVRRTLKNYPLLSSEKEDKKKSPSMEGWADWKKEAEYLKALVAYVIGCQASMEAILQSKGITTHAEINAYAMDSMKNQKKLMAEALNKLKEISDPKQ